MCIYMLLEVTYQSTQTYTCSVTYMHTFCCFHTANMRTNMLCAWHIPVKMRSYVCTLVLLCAFRIHTHLFAQPSNEFRYTNTLTQSSYTCTPALLATVYTCSQFYLHVPHVQHTLRKMGLYISLAAFPL